MLAAIGEQLAHIGARHLGRSHQQVRRFRHGSDGRQVFGRVVRKILEQADAAGGGGHADHHQRVAIGLAAGHVVSADDAVGARLVFHDHGLAQIHGHMLAQAARHHVGDAAGREGHDHPDRVVGIGGRERRCGCRQPQAERQGNGRGGSVHDVVSRWWV
ncbi:hypothetical protein D3C72_1781050 [compost metagenome]